jgi:hypothetical protein
VYTFYTYGHQLSKRHVQTVEGKVLCGARGYLMDGGCAPYEYDGKECLLIENDKYSGRRCLIAMKIEMVVDCKKCRAALERIVATPLAQSFKMEK